MKLPSWVPQVLKPWNPAYHDTWGTMSPNDRRWSFLVDVVIVGMVLGLCGIWAYFEHASKI